MTILDICRPLRFKFISTRKGLFFKKIDFYLVLLNDCKKKKKKILEKKLKNKNQDMKILKKMMQILCGAILLVLLNFILKMYFLFWVHCLFFFF